MNKYHTKGSNKNNNVINLGIERLIKEAGSYFIHSRDYTTALDRINKVLAIEPYKINALVLKGEILFCMDKEQESLDCFDKAIVTDPYCIEAYGSKAGTLDVLGKQKEALDCCQKAFDNLGKKDEHLLPSLYDQKIALLLRLKKYDEARNALKSCIGRLPEEDSSYLISCYEELIESYYKKKLVKLERLKKIQLKVVN